MLLDQPQSLNGHPAGDGSTTWATAHRVIDGARQRLSMSPEQLRIASWGFGGNVPLGQLTEYLDGRGPLDEQDYNSLVAAVNDRFSELGLSPSIPYSEDYRRPRSASLDHRS